MAAFLVYHGTLLVHYIIVFEQMFTDTEVVFLNLFLRTFYAVVNHGRFDYLTFLEAEFVHNLGYTF